MNIYSIDYRTARLKPQHGPRLDDTVAAAATIQPASQISYLRQITRHQFACRRVHDRGAGADIEGFMACEVRFDGKAASPRGVTYVYIAPEGARPADDRIFSPLQEERAMRFGVDARKSERRNLHIAFMRSGFAQRFSNELRQAV